MNQSLSIRAVAGMVLVAFLWAICFPFIVVGLPDAPPLLLPLYAHCWQGSV